MAKKAFGITKQSFLPEYFDNIILNFDAIPWREASLLLLLLFSLFALKFENIKVGTMKRLRILTFDEADLVSDSSPLSVADSRFSLDNASSCNQ